MIDLILSLLGKAIYPIIAALGGLLVFLFQRNKIKRQADKIEQQDRAIGGYKVKEEIHKQDLQTELNTNRKLNELREKVDNAESPEQGAGEVSGAINDYFGGNK